MGSVSFRGNFLKSFKVAGEKNIPWVNVKLFNITQVSRLQTSIRVNNILLDWWAGYNSIISGCHLCLVSCYLKKCLQLPLRYSECFFLIEVSNCYIHTWVIQMNGSYTYPYQYIQHRVSYCVHPGGYIPTIHSSCLHGKSKNSSTNVVGGQVVGSFVFLWNLLGAASICGTKPVFD